MGGSSRIPDGGGSPKIITDPKTNVGNEENPPNLVTGDGIDTHNIPVETGGGSITESSDVSNVLLNRGRDAELTGSGDASAREAIDTLAALLGTEPSTAISARALATLESLGHIETIDRSVLVELRGQAKSLQDDMAALDKLDASIAVAREAANSVGARIGSWFGGDRKAEAEKKLAELRKQRSVVAKRLGEEPAMKLEKVEAKIAAIRETEHGLVQVRPSAQPLLELLQTEPRATSIRDFLTRFKSFQAGIDEAAAIEKKVFDAVSNCGDTASSLYALVLQHTGKSVADVEMLHDWLWDAVDECGARATAILGATALMTNESKEDLKSDYRFLFDETEKCGDTAAATLVYACALTGATKERAQTLYRDLFDNTEKCGDEASAILTLAVLKHDVEVEEVRATYRRMYDPPHNDNVGDVAAAVMVVEKVAGRASESQLRADFRAVYDSTDKCGDYESVLLGRAARRTDLSPKLWAEVQTNIFTSRPDLQDSAASLLAAGAASKLTSPEDHENLLELGVLALGGREDEIDDAEAAEASRRRSGSSSGYSSSDDGNDFNFGFGQGWGLGYKGYGYYTSGLKIL